MITLEQLNATDRQGFVDALDGIYEHSPWIAAGAWARRPFGSLARLKLACAEVVRAAGRDAGIELLRAHPELAGPALDERTLTQASGAEQRAAGLAGCTPDERARLRQLTADYRRRHGFPFVLAVRGPRGHGLDRAEVCATLERRLGNPTDVELAEGLRNVHRIAEIRLGERFGDVPVLGHAVWDRAERLAAHSDAPWAERGLLTVTYLTEAHRACAAQLAGWMRDDCGFDEVHVDAVGNVVGLYHGSDRQARRLLTGSHYDTVRNAGRYDGRLGILVPMACVGELSRARRRLPFGIEVVAFAEEEGQRYKAAFLGSSALVGRFDPAWLEQRDADGVTLRDAMRGAGLRPDDIPALRRDPARYLGFVEVHIEQGPVLAELDLPLGVVTSINGGLRFLGDIVGVASHAGTTPMGRRRDAATAAAELALFVERRAAMQPDVVATVGLLEVPGGSINVVPGRCRFSLDVRATTDAVRDAAADDMRRELQAICERRGLRHTLEETMRAAAAPSDATWQRRWERAVEALGLPPHRMPSGAGHDAMKLHEVMPQAMLFVRGLNGGISHNPLESITADDAELAVRAMGALLEQLAAETA